MPVMNGCQLLKTIKLDRRYSYIPFLLSSSKEVDHKTKINFLKNGAIDFVEKSTSFLEIKYKIENILKIKKKDKTELIQSSIIS